MAKSKIEWTELTVNPVRARRTDGTNRVPGHYCEKVSPGCANCYASAMQPRFGMPQFPGVGRSPEDTGVEVFFDSDCLLSLLRKKGPARVFWCSMTDWCGEWVKPEWRDTMLAVAALTPGLTHLFLTKRAAAQREYLSDGRTRNEVCQIARVNARRHNLPHEPIRELMWPLPNVWVGVTCENQAMADARMPDLLRTPAARRFLSLEPLLGPIEMCGGCPGCPNDCGWLPHDGGGIDLVIVGGESGPRARPCSLDRVRSIVAQCREAGVACFVKQLGSHPVHPSGFGLYQDSPKGGDPEEWPEDLWVREWPGEAAVTHCAGCGREMPDTPGAGVRRGADAG